MLSMIVYLVNRSFWQWGKMMHHDRIAIDSGLPDSGSDSVQTIVESLQVLHTIRNFLFTSFHNLHPTTPNEISSDKHYSCYSTKAF